MSFLDAEWRKLVLANYTIDKSLVERYIPAGTELDLWQGRCYVSLVGFMFLNVKLMGMKIPFHVNFEEVNLRFYVKRFENGSWKRGVVFIKEIVPKRALAWVANTVYKENYEAMPMRHVWAIDNDQLGVEYAWQKHGQWHSIRVQSVNQSFKIEPQSETEFITEHYWGYAQKDHHTSVEYEVKHPRWEVYEVKDHTIDVDFGQVYGEDFSILNTVEPISVMLAEGSPITVEYKQIIKAHTI